MKTLTLLFCLICLPCFGAELLIMARDCPSGDAFRKGDIVSVAEDGFYEKSTGYTLENGFIIRKMPGVAVADVKMYEESLTEQVARVETIAPAKGQMTTQTQSAELQEMTSKTIRLRKYSVPVSEVDTIVSSGINVQRVDNYQVSLHPITEKNITDEKADIDLGEGVTLE